MLTLRAYMALAGIGLVVALALTLIAWGRERGVSADLRDDLATANRQHSEQLKAAREQGVRNGAVAAAQAQACGVEGSAAFDRGVQVGMAVCAARR